LQYIFPNICTFLYPWSLDMYLYVTKYLQKALQKTPKGVNGIHPLRIVISTRFSLLITEIFQWKKKVKSTTDPRNIGFMALFYFNNILVKLAGN
jgi:hypothetical protein